MLTGLHALTMPPRLRAGARIALVSPSGPLRNAADVDRAVANARDMSWEPVVGARALARAGYFAGSDAERLSDLQWAIDDEDIDGIWCIRGGYGAARLLSALDVDSLHTRPKALIGYSDITALHSAWQRIGLTSFHGPTARAELTVFSRESFARTVSQAADATGAMPQARTLRAGTATGRLAGGNLALVASLCGTHWAIDFADTIVVLEDINEATYRLDRMLLQLRLAGAFDRCAGLLLGQFTDCPPDSDDGARSLGDIMQEFADSVGVPAVLGAPVGHVADQWTLPLGAIATLVASRCTLTLHPGTR
ncbi:MAG: LD-carboxypeptidase [Gemmatimonas sp.]